MESKKIDQKAKRLTLKKEVSIEKKLSELAVKYRGLSLKLTCPGTSGMPDRIFIMPKRGVWFVELKKPKNGMLSPIQIVVHRLLRNMGCRVWVIWNELNLKQFENEITGIK